MAARAKDEFYVGYLDRAPAGLARWLKAVALVLAAAVPLILAVVAAGQREHPSGAFEFGIQREFEGILYETPLPALRVEGPGGAAADSLVLVGFGKSGIPPVARGHHGERVRFRGSLVYRQNVAMVEMNDPGSFEPLGPPDPPVGGRLEVAGEVELTGELVDTKCFLGVMRPATGKVHRACAVRCLKGGVPPGILVHDAEGGGTVIMLAGPAGGPLDFDLELAGREIRVRGRLEVRDGLPVLYVEAIDPA
jgi:hypothetical protein